MKAKPPCPISLFALAAIAVLADCASPSNLYFQKPTSVIKPVIWRADTPSASSKSPTRFTTPRSEEHTSELQSPCNLVCRLLLEKNHNTQGFRGDFLIFERSGVL